MRLFYKPSDYVAFEQVLGQEKGTSLILTDLSRYGNFRECHEQRDPPKRERFTTFSIVGAGKGDITDIDGFVAVW
jgi:hypothetical protein